MKNDIKELLIKAQQGDEDAFTQICILYENSVYTKAKKIMKNHADAQDVVQETFMVVHRALQQLRDIEVFYSWLMRVTVSQCHIHFRKEKHKLNLSDDTFIMNQKEHRIYLDPEKNSQNVSEQELLLEMIDSLPPKKAIIIRMAYLDGLQMDEIAELLNENINTVKSRARRGKEELKTIIEAYESKEQVTIQFHADLILPSSFFLTATHSTFITTIWNKFTQLSQYIKQNVWMSSCYASLSTLLISGSVFIAQDVQQNYKQNSNSLTMESEQTNKGTNKQMSASFTPVLYAEQQIETPRQAYFSCLNFAYDMESMSKRTKAESQELYPVYEALKYSKSPYFQRLQTLGWIQLYEALIASFQ